VSETSKIVDYDNLRTPEADSGLRRRGEIRALKPRPRKTRRRSASGIPDGRSSGNLPRSACFNIQWGRNDCPGNHLAWEVRGTLSRNPFPAAFFPDVGPEKFESSLTMLVTWFRSPLVALIYYSLGISLAGIKCATTTSGQVAISTSCQQSALPI